MLGRIEFSLTNVLIPECTHGVTFDALYCDAAIGEEDLPMLLSLLKPNGRMVVIIQEVHAAASVRVHVCVHNCLLCIYVSACGGLHFF